MPLSKNIKKALFLFFISLLFLPLIFFKLSSTSADESDTFSINDPDAIAVRIIPNPNNYDIQQWYRMQGFSGSPQAIIIDGYKAIRDGRTVYISASNVDLDSSKIYFNIYLISYNQEADENTIDIFGRILKNWKLNTNIKESIGTCSVPLRTCKTSSDCPADYACGGWDAESGELVGELHQQNKCIIKEDNYDEIINTPYCILDSECPSGLLCSSYQARVIRDMDRMSKLQEIRSKIENYRNLNGHYPIIDSGTYVPNIAISSWPSWNSIFLKKIGATNLVDPVNTLGNCHNAMANFDLKTCWDPSSLSFLRIGQESINHNNFSLPEYSTVFSYVSDPAGLTGSIYISMETNIYEGVDFEFPDGTSGDDNDPPYDYYGDDDDPESSENSFFHPFLNFDPSILEGHSGLPIFTSLEVGDPRGLTITFVPSDCIVDAKLHDSGEVISSCPNVSEHWSSWSPSNRPVLNPTGNPYIYNLQATKAGKAENIYSTGPQVESTKEYIMGVILKNYTQHEISRNLKIYITNYTPTIENENSYAHNFSHYQDIDIPLSVYDISSLDNLSLCILNSAGGDCVDTWNLNTSGNTEQDILSDFVGSSSFATHFNNSLKMKLRINSNRQTYNLNILNTDDPSNNIFNYNNLGTYYFRIFADDGYGATTSKDFYINFSAFNPAIVFIDTCPNSITLDTPFQCIISTERSVLGEEVIVTNQTVTKMNEKIHKVGVIEIGKIDKVKIEKVDSFLSYDSAQRKYTGTPTDPSHLGSHTISVNVKNEFNKTSSASFTFNVYTVPDVTTASVNSDSADIGTTSFKCKGNVVNTNFNTSNGLRGCVVSTANNFSTSDYNSVDKCNNNSPFCDYDTTTTLSVGNFQKNLSNLDVNTRYYYRAFAANQAGFGFGQQESFHTRANSPHSDVPTVVKGAGNSADLSSTVISNGEGAIKNVGFFWGTSSNLTFPASCTEANNCILLSPSIDFSHLNVSIPNIGTNYYFKSFVINEDGAGRTRIYTSNNSEFALYSVAYQLNGGSPDIATANYGKGSVVTVSPTSVTKTGYNFTNWYGNGTNTYTAGDTFTINANVVLGAQWTAKTTTINFNRQGGTGGTETVTATYDQAMPSASAPTKTGYDFTGYRIGTTSGDFYYNSGMGSSKNWDKEDVTKDLYAQWTPRTYTATVTANPSAGGTVNGGGPYAYNSSVTITATANSSHTFSGWTGDSCPSSCTTSSCTFTMPANNITCIANFTLKTHTVTVTSSSYGSTNPDGPWSVNHGDILSIQIQPSTGYIVGSINGCSGVLTSHANNYYTYDTGVVTSACTVTVTFTADTTTPTVTTTSISSITSNSASSGGNVTSDGGASVTARGVVWSTSQNPTISSPGKTTNGAGTGNFTSNLSGLTANTTYYVRAYATNSAGTAYGNQVNFLTSVPGPYAVTYNGNNNTGGSSPESQEKIHDVTLTLATNYGGLTREGYTFNGWNTNTSGTGVSYSVGASYPTNANLNLYARWTCSNDRQITLTNCRGGSSSPLGASGSVILCTGNSSPAASLSGSSASFFVGSSGDVTVTITPNASTRVRIGMPCEVIGSIGTAVSCTYNPDTHSNVQYELLGGSDSHICNLW